MINGMFDFKQQDNVPAECDSDIFFNIASRMETKPNRTYFTQLDGFRAIAVLAVMVAHYIKPLSGNLIFTRLPWGNGVTLFFVISGFLITRILLDIKESANSPDGNRFYSIRSFYIRRALRIFPIYYLTLIVLYAANYDKAIEYFPWLITYTVNIKMSLANSYIGNVTHFWSLAVEEQFYMGWAFLIIFFPKRQVLNLIIATIFLSIVYKFYLYYYTGMWMGINALTMSNMDQLGLGALLAYLYNYKKAVVIKIAKLNWLLILLTLVFIFIYVFPAFELFKPIQKVYKGTFVGLLSFFLLAKASLGTYKGLFAALIESKLFVYIGRISYGVYIYHNLMNALFFGFLNRYLQLNDAPAFVYVLIYTALTFTIASLSWFIIEKPINSFKTRFPYKKIKIVKDN